MEIKILCSCGAKFKFDVEPVNGKSPAPVNCPACGKESTDATNALIQEQLAPPPAPTPVAEAPKAPRISVMAAPTPPAASGAEPPKVSIPSVRIPGPAAHTAAPAPPPAAAVAPAVAIPTSNEPKPTGAPKMAFMPVPETTKALSVKPPGEATEHAAPPPSAPAPSGEPKAAGSPKMAYMPVPETTKSLSVKPPGEATEHAAPPPSVPSSSNASGDPKAPGSPKMAFMPAPAAGGTSLSVAGHGKKEEAAATPAGQPAPSEPAPVRAHPAAAKLAKVSRPSGSIRFGAGYAGAIIGALIGMAIWYFAVITTGKDIKFLAIVVGVLSGFAAKFLGGGKHDKLATAAGTATALAILLGEFLAVSFISAEVVDLLVETKFKDRITSARSVAAAKTDKDLRAAMVDDAESPVFEKNPDELTDEEIAAYKKNNVPAMKKFADGTPSRTQFETKYREELEASGAGKLHFNFRILIFVVVGVTAAWKIVKPPEKD